MSAAVQLDAFAQSHHASKRALEIMILAPLAWELAVAAQEQGVTVGEIRAEAERRRYFDPRATRNQRALSYLSAVPKAAGLVPTNRRRTNPANRNANVVFVIPRCAR